MEETLGKRIVANRKRLGITQDRLAEQLGVTAQAVSKWENDQSCPDITMLPKLAEIFGISVDALLGLEQPEKEPVHEGEIVTEEDSGTDKKNHWEFRWNGGSRPKVWFAVWVLLMGGMMLLNLLTNRWHISFWDMAWPSALLLFGLSGLYPDFSFFRLGCALFGGYSLLENMELTYLGLSSKLLLIIALLLFGLSLLVDALRNPEKSHFTVTHNGKIAKKSVSNCDLGDASFDCSTAFSENSHLIDLPLLRRGDIAVSFGELTVDLSGCREFAYGCYVNADCAFGELTILVPSRVRVEVDSDAAFGAVDVRGECDRDAVDTIHVKADVSFGQITIKYI